MPRAVIADALGPIASYALRAHDPGPPGPTQVKIAVKAAGVSFVDVLTAEGRYHVAPPTPFIPGSECAGIVAATGAQVKAFAVGQPVVATGFGGIFAETVNLPARSIWPMPANQTFAQAAVFPVSYTTAWHALIDRGSLRAGETLLVLGAGGASGYAAVQIGKHLGARVIASASSEAKRRMALAGGADAAVNARSESWREDLKKATGGRPFDVIFDPVGGESTEAAFRTLGWNGRHLIIGFPGGIAALRTNLPLLKGASLIGVNLRQFGEVDLGRAEANRGLVFALAARGVLMPVVAERFSLEQFAAAMAAAAAGRSAGRIVLTIGEQE
ncbi:MAG TPA: NADPH:quinone oxidoreductase family protein [Steroidobacteraceae bacterium]|nr:NADPH:quinone oxidoreductase family protein [Steroidobacteraceae bacterium]